MAQRDNFSELTKALLAKCVRIPVFASGLSTADDLGPALGEGGWVNAGEAAHITAAAAGGPRYDGSLSRDERRSYSNGIWMCGIHAKQRDSDDKHFTVDLLRDWSLGGRYGRSDCCRSASLVATRYRSTKVSPPHAVAIVAAFLALRRFLRNRSPHSRLSPHSYP